MNLAIWDIESSSANTSWGSIIEVGGILVDPNFKELDRFNFRCRLPEGEVPQAMALIVNKTSVDLLTKGNLSHYQMLSQLEATLYYPGKYAGTCDAVGVYEGQETIIDFKQSNKPKKEEWIEDYYLQLGAYSLAHNVVHNSKITQGIVLLCTVDNLFQDFRIQGEKLEEYQNKFLEKVEQYYHQQNMN